MGLEVYFKFILSFALILIAARLGGEFAERYLKQPRVLGQLVAGVIISPFALGGLIFGSDPIILNFATISGQFVQTGEAISDFNIMEIISQIAVVILLFVAGVETDVRSFVRSGITGGAVAIGGVILPFLFGYLITWALYPVIGMTGFLFMGAVLTTTSIGVTVKILMDMGRLQTREGTTILVGAVVDDIIGIVILSVAVSMARTGVLDVGHALQVGAIGIVVWFALLIAGVRFNKYISSIFLNPFKRSGTMPIVAIIIGLLIAYLVTLIGLHPVIGAYVAGLMFAATREREEILHGIRPIMLFLAPFFFCYLGMQVDMRLSSIAAIITVVLIILATLGKVIGCYIPARFVGRLSHNSSMIVGLGMVPRGEVGLIIAGAGLLAVGEQFRELFAVAVLVSIATTLITPAMLKPFFRRALAEGLESGSSLPEE
jgi:Kef-type K+ transport system membrane component KefB